MLKEVSNPPCSPSPRSWLLKDARNTWMSKEGKVGKGWGGGTEGGKEISTEKEEKGGGGRKY